MLLLGIGIERVKIGTVDGTNSAVSLISGPKYGISLARASNPICQNRTIKPVQNRLNMLLQIVLKNSKIPILNIINSRKSIRLHSPISVLVLRISHSNGMGFLVDFYYLVDVAVVEFCVEGVCCWGHFYGFCYWCGGGRGGFGFFLVGGLVGLDLLFLAGV